MKESSQTCLYFNKKDDFVLILTILKSLLQFHIKLTRADETYSTI